jgi:PEGA domain-containing protein
MKKLFIVPAFVALLVAGSAYALYKTGEPQHRKPADQGQPAQPRPPDTPKTSQAVPRPPDARNEPPDHPRRGPEGPRGPERVVVPYPGWPWWGYGYPYPYGYPPASPWRLYADWETSNVRIDVSPNDASVYVDGYYAGAVDDFDGIFQHLVLRAGLHLIEIRRTGYTTLAVELNLYPGQSVTYRRTMQPSSVETGVTAAAHGAPGFEEGAVPPAPADLTAPPGEVRFDVTPNDAEIYADGFYVGIVDDFNGSQRLQLPPGRHHVAVKMDGYESIEFDLSIESTRSITYRATLKRLN